MTNWNKSAIYGGIYASSLHQENCAAWRSKHNQKIWNFSKKLENAEKIVRKFRKKSEIFLLLIKNNLKTHLSQKQEFYWPVLIAITLLLFVFVSRIAFAEIDGTPNNLPIEHNSKLNRLIGFQKVGPGKTCLANVQDIQTTSKTENQTQKDENKNDDKEALKRDISKILKNTPMAAMIDSIAEHDRTVAAFIVGIAMKESKFGVYSPKLNNHDCYNYWGFKGGGKTIAGGYTCFSSPEDAVATVGKQIEKMVARGVRHPAQAISWKCGSTCAGHNSADIRKWIADVSVNFYKINS